MRQLGLQNEYSLSSGSWCIPYGVIATESTDKDAKQWDPNYERSDF
jgi:hypothetical protein